MIRSRRRLECNEGVLFFPGIRTKHRNSKNRIDKSISGCILDFLKNFPGTNHFLIGSMRCVVFSNLRMGTTIWMSSLSASIAGLPDHAANCSIA